MTTPIAPKTEETFSVIIADREGDVRPLDTYALPDEMAQGILELNPRARLVHSGLRHETANRLALSLVTATRQQHRDTLGIPKDSIIAS